MPLAAPILETTLRDRRPDRHGKVRDIYDFGDRLLIVATDRISAFDYVLASGIPDKGKVLTQISAFWFERTRSIVDNHVLSIDTADYPADARVAAGVLAGRSMLVKKTEPLPIECVARGYLSGSAWNDYRTTGEVCGIRLPPGLRESDRLPQPIFTPATKAQTGHDINISEAEAAELVGPRVLARVRDLTLRLYAEGAAYAERCGIIVADTKFEFGLLPLGEAGGASGGRPDDDRVIVIDEVLTPDSSRFWPRDTYRAWRCPAELRQAIRPRLPDRHSLEQAAARALAARRRGDANARRCVEAYAGRGSGEPDTSGVSKFLWHRGRREPAARRGRGIPEYLPDEQRGAMIGGRSEIQREQAVISDKLERLVEEMVDKGVRFTDAMHEFEKRFITRVLNRNDGSLTRTADVLGMHRNTLTRKMSEHKIKRRAV